MIPCCFSPTYKSRLPKHLRRIVFPKTSDAPKWHSVISRFVLDKWISASFFGIISVVPENKDRQSNKHILSNSKLLDCLSLSFCFLFFFLLYMYKIPKNIPCLTWTRKEKIIGENNFFLRLYVSPISFIFHFYAQFENFRPLFHFLFFKVFFRPNFLRLNLNFFRPNLEFRRKVPPKI